MSPGVLAATEPTRENGVARLSDAAPADHGGIDTGDDVTYYQIDFVQGEPIENLGPSGTDNFYGAQDRLIRYLHGTNETKVESRGTGAPSGRIQHCVDSEEMRVGDHAITIDVDVTDGCSIELSLVAHGKAGPGFDPDRATEQEVHDHETRTVGPGRYTFCVDRPGTDEEGCRDDDEDDDDDDDRENREPDAVIEYRPNDPFLGDDVLLDGSASTDEDGEIVSYRWDLDDDLEFEAQGVEALYRLTPIDPSRSNEARQDDDGDRGGPDGHPRGFDRGRDDDAGQDRDGDHPGRGLDDEDDVDNREDDGKIPHAVLQRQIRLRVEDDDGATDDEVVTIKPRRPERDQVDVISQCAGQYKVKNPGDGAVTVRWKTLDTNESGTVSIGPEQFRRFRTGNGTVVNLYVDGERVRTRRSRSNSCDPETSEALDLHSVCNGRWLIENEVDREVGYAWNTSFTGASGSGRIGPGENRYFNTSENTTVRLYADGTIVEAVIAMPLECGESPEDDEPEEEPDLPPEALELTSVCNERWEVANPNNRSVTYHWSTAASDDNVTATVAANTTETFRTGEDATITLFIDGVTIDSASAVATPCEDADGEEPEEPAPRATATALCNGRWRVTNEEDAELTVRWETARDDSVADSARLAPGGSRIVDGPEYAILRVFVGDRLEASVPASPEPCEDAKPDGPPVTVTSLCNARWRVENRRNETVEYSWRVLRTGESGGGTLAPDETDTFDTALDSTLRVSVEGSLVAQTPSAPTLCAGRHDVGRLDYRVRGDARIDRATSHRFGYGISEHSRLVGTELTNMTIRYPEGGVNLTPLVDGDPDTIRDGGVVVSFDADRDGFAERRSIQEGGSVTVIDERTIAVTFGTTPSIDGRAEIRTTIYGLRNGADPGRFDASVTVNDRETLDDPFQVHEGIGPPEVRILSREDPFCGAPGDHERYLPSGGGEEEIGPLEEGEGGGAAFPQPRCARLEEEPRVAGLQEALSLGGDARRDEFHEDEEDAPTVYDCANEDQPVDEPMTVLPPLTLAPGLPEIDGGEEPSDEERVCLVYPLEVRVRHSEHEALSDASITINNETVLTEPVLEGDFAHRVRAELRLTERVNHVEVTVAANGKSDSDVLRLDGDALPDYYETDVLEEPPIEGPAAATNVTGTAPLDHGRRRARDTTERGRQRHDGR